MMRDTQRSRNEQRGNMLEDDARLRNPCGYSRAAPDMSGLRPEKDIAMRHAMFLAHSLMASSMRRMRIPGNA